MIERLFSVDHHDVAAAKLQHASGLAGVELEKMKHQRFRWDTQKYSFLHQWLQSNYGSKDGDAFNADRRRQDIRARLYPMYRRMARESGVEPASQTSFYDAMGDGFCDQNSENCCCGQCIEGLPASTALCLH